MNRFYANRLPGNCHTRTQSVVSIYERSTGQDSDVQGSFGRDLDARRLRGRA